MQAIVCALMPLLCPVLAFCQHMMIHEIFADPSPSAGLPEYEFIELYNPGPDEVDLAGWMLKDSSASVKLPAYRLQADSFVVLCSRTGAPFFPASLGITGFPSLANDGELISLYDPQGRLIHAVDYTKAWYGGGLKAEGGWTLEMVSPQWPCTGMENWKASTSPSGGTPGRMNAVAGNIEEPPVPELSRISVTGGNQVHLHFSGIIDSASAVDVAHYDLPFSAATAWPRKVTLEIPLEPGKIYTLQINGVKDCKGRPVRQLTPARFGLPALPAAGDLLINEILFDPLQGGYDFVELYHAGTHPADLYRLQFASRGSDGALRQIVPLVKDHWLLMPGDHLAFCEEPTALCRQYSCKGAVVQTSALPTLPADEGNILLLQQDGEVLDALSYQESEHFPLLQQRKGVSLERAAPGIWHSAASTAGYATPGYVNSRQITAENVTGTFSVSPETFSPNLDGHDDLALIRWNTASTGQAATITVFDSQGRPIRSLGQNLTLSTAGSIAWDGLSDSREALPAGVYIIHIRMFDLQGRTGQWKLPVVLHLE